jgi:H+/Cl- antiporter ClcA
MFGALIGIPAALVAAGFLGLVHYLQGWLWTDLPHALGASSPPWYLVVGLPAVGALIVVVARRFLPGDGGHEPLEGLSEKPTPVAHAPGVALAAVATLGFGAVLGPESPVIALGSVVGMALSHIVRLDSRRSGVLSLAGSSAAISAVFDGPLVAGLLMTEGGVGMGAALLPVLVPGLVAAAIGYVLFIGLGSWGGLNAPGLLVPNLPPYTGTHLLDLVLALIVGALAALLIRGVHRVGAAIDRLRSRVGMTLVLIGGGLLVGALAELATLLGASSQDVLFSGQHSMPALITAGSTRIVLVLLVFKAAGYAVCLGCGFRGGPIFPAIFLGVALASLAVVWFGVSPTLAIAVGAAAGMAAQTRLLVSPLLFALLLVGSNGLDAVSATVLASVGAWLVTSALDRRTHAAAAPDSPR